MKTFKIVLGAVLGLTALNVMITMSEEEKGAGLFGALTGFFVIGGLSVWLIYNGLKTK